jgi:hypothetical protein
MIKAFKICSFFAALLCTVIGQLYAQTNLTIKDGEKWYGGAVNEAHLMPFKEGYSLDMYGDTKGNQAVPLLVSTKGRFIWSDEPFKFAFEKNRLVISNAKAGLTIDSAGKNLHDAFTNAAQKINCPILYCSAGRSTIPG